MAMVTMCDLLGWTYDQYMEQPQWFVALLIGKKEIDAMSRSKK